jgi:hypothetical protein
MRRMSEAAKRDANATLAFGSRRERDDAVETSHRDRE